MYKIWCFYYNKVYIFVKYDKYFEIDLKENIIFIIYVILNVVFENFF